MELMTHLGFGHATAVVPVHEWGNFEVPRLLLVALQEEFITQLRHLALMQALRAQQVPNVSTLQCHLQPPPAELACWSCSRLASESHQ